MAPTQKQQQIFEAILFLTEKGENPTVREIGAMVNLRSPATVMKHLRALEREGLISLSGRSRGIKLVDRRSASFIMPSPLIPLFSPLIPPKGTVAFPGAGTSSSADASAGGIALVGRIAAGRPVEAVALPSSTREENVFPQIGIHPDVFAGSGELLALEVAGDSMIDVGILDGDYVIIRRQPVVEEGEIAAVEVDGEVTLKRWYGAGSSAERPGSSVRRSSSVRLVGANPGFSPIEITAGDHKEVRVLGKYVGLVRGELRLR